MIAVENRSLFKSARQNLMAAILNGDADQILTQVATIESLRPHVVMSFNNVKDIANLIARATTSLMRAQPPKGISNKNENCWAIAAMQMIVNSKGLSQLIFENRHKPLCGVLAAQMARYPSASVKSETIREVMHEIMPDNAGHQRDPIDLLHALIEELGISLLCQTGIVNHMNDPLSGQQTEEVSAVIDFELNEMDTPIFNELLERFFIHSVEHNDGNYKKIQYIGSPEHLFIQAKRIESGTGVAGGARKIGTPILGIPLMYELPSKYTTDSDSATYQLTGCVIHKGTQGNFGHYVALERKPDGTWYLINDALVFRWDAEAKNWFSMNAGRLIDQETERGFVEVDGAYTPKEILARGYLFHYEKNEEQAGSSSSHQAGGAHAHSNALVPTKDRGPSFLRSIFSAVGNLGFYVAYVPYKVVQVTLKTIANVALFSVSTIWNRSATKKYL
ncbi:MAG: hypothetical protein KR126chlam1_00267 [Chlamydiae bacterium]|nr:hypothetical protein [Chlamydiota bacterium]